MKGITANHLKGGQVVFFASNGVWSEKIEDIALFEDKEALGEALTAASKDEERQIVVGVYDIDMEVGNGAPVPVKLRERIRAEGPTTAYGDAMKLERFYAA